MNTIQLFENEICVIQNTSTKDLAQENNVLVTGGFVYTCPSQVSRWAAKFLEIRRELVIRGILADEDDIRQIDGKELNVEP